MAAAINRPPILATENYETMEEKKTMKYPDFIVVTVESDQSSLVYTVEAVDAVDAIEAVNRHRLACGLEIANVIAVEAGYPILVRNPKPTDTLYDTHYEPNDDW